MVNTIVTAMQNRSGKRSDIRPNPVAQAPSSDAQKSVQLPRKRLFGTRSLITRIDGHDSVHFKKHYKSN
jgi:hypothetical protein